MYRNVLGSYLNHVLQEAFCDLWSLGYLPSITILTELTFRTSLTKNLRYYNCLFSIIFTPSKTTNSWRPRTIALLFTDRKPVSGSTNILWTWVFVYSVTQSCLTLCSPVDCSLPGSPAHGIFQARVLEWVAISYCNGSSQPRDWTCISCVSCIGSKILYHQCYLESLKLETKGK